MENIYKSADQKFNKTKSSFNYNITKTTMYTDGGTTQQSTPAYTEDNFGFRKSPSEKKFIVNPNYIKQINNISNNPTINHLLNVIVKLKFFFNLNMIL
jgi:hypothetical protein